jgi:hypothetical protein
MGLSVSGDREGDGSGQISGPPIMRETACSSWVGKENFCSVVKALQVEELGNVPQIVDRRSAATTDLCLVERLCRNAEQRKQDDG